MSVISITNIIVDAVNVKAGNLNAPSVKSINFNRCYFV